MKSSTRQKLNTLRPPLLQLALHNMRGKPGALAKRYEQIAFSSGLGEAYVLRRVERDERRAKNKAARASRKANRR